MVVGVVVDVIVIVEVVSSRSDKIFFIFLIVLIKQKNVLLGTKYFKRKIKSLKT